MTDSIHRRMFLAGGMGALGAAVMSPLAQGAEDSAAPAPADGPRPEGKGSEAESQDIARPDFKIVLSNDINTLARCVSPYNPDGKQPFRPEMMVASVDEVVGTGVEVIKYVPGFGWIPRWQSKVYPVREHYEWQKKVYGKFDDGRGYLQYVLDGGDCVELFVNRCREKGIIPFLSFRPNDYQLGEARNRFVQEHPEFRLGASQYTKGCENYINFIHPEVRDYRLEFIRELCHYDIDGLELDFMRRPPFFRLDQTTSQERMAVMTDFIGKVRQILQQTSSRHRWLCARVPCHLAEYDLWGLDLRAMIGEGVEILNVSPSYFTQQQTDLAEIVRIVPEAAVYLEGSDVIDRPRPGIRLVRNTTDQQWYTAAHLAYSRGAVGMFTFNFHFYSRTDRTHYEPPFHIFKHLGDPGWLARQPQYYFLARGYGGYDPAFEGRTTTMMMRHARYAPQSPFPCALAPGQRLSCSLDMAPPAGGWKQEGRLRIQGSESLAGREYSAVLNGTVALKSTTDVSEPYPSPYQEMLGKPDELRAWIVPPSAVFDGMNRIDITQTSGNRAEFIFLDLAIG